MRNATMELAGTPPCFLSVSTDNNKIVTSYLAELLNKNCLDNSWSLTTLVAQVKIIYLISHFRSG